MCSKLGAPVLPASLVLGGMTTCEHDGIVEGIEQALEGFRPWVGEHHRRSAIGSLFNIH